MDDILRLLDEVKLLLGQKPDYSTPKRVLIFYEFLSDRSKFMPYLHEYEFEDRIMHPVKAKIRHGHKYDQLCAAPCFCHDAIYRPKVTDHPLFIKNFYAKWPEYLYEERG